MKNFGVRNDEVRKKTTSHKANSRINAKNAGIACPLKTYNPISTNINS